MTDSIIPESTVLDDEWNEYGRYEIDGYDDLNEWETNQVYADQEYEDYSDCDCCGDDCCDE